MRIVLRTPQVLAAIGLVSLVALVLGLVSQYVFGMQPCPWCVLQRLIYVVIGVLALAAAAAAPLRRTLAGLALLACAGGLAAALWQQFYAANQDSCVLTLAERITTGLHLDRVLPQVFIAYASCADAAVNVLGVPYALWSAALFVLLGAGLAWALRVAGCASRG